MFSSPSNFCCTFDVFYATHSKHIPIFILIGWQQVLPLSTLQLLLSALQLMLLTPWPMRIFVVTVLIYLSSPTSSVCSPIDAPHSLTNENLCSDSLDQSELSDFFSLLSNWCSSLCDQWESLKWQSRPIWTPQFLLSALQLMLLTLWPMRIFEVRVSTNLNSPWNVPIKMVYVSYSRVRIYIQEPCKVCHRYQIDGLFYELA